jgi:hypothetical protein
MSQPRLSVKQVSRRALLATNFKLASCLAYSMTLNMEATRSSEKSVHFQRTTLYYIPEDRSFHNHRCENLNSYMMNEFLNIFIVQVKHLWTQCSNGKQFQSEGRQSKDHVLHTIKHG